MEKSKYDFWVGSLHHRRIFALAFLALQVGDVNSERSRSTYNVEARFENIGGPQIEGPGQERRVLVGRVTDIRFDNQKFQAVATLALDTGYKFPKGHQCLDSHIGLLGEVYVGLDAGGDDKVLAAGDKITLTQSAVVLERLIRQMMFSKASEGAGDKK